MTGKDFACIITPSLELVDSQRARPDPRCCVQNPAQALAVIPMLSLSGVATPVARQELPVLLNRIALDRTGLEDPVLASTGPVLGTEICRAPPVHGSVGITFI